MWDDFPAVADMRSVWMKRLCFTWLHALVPQ